MRNSTLNLPGSLSGVLNQKEPISRLTAFSPLNPKLRLGHVGIGDPFLALAEGELDHRRDAAGIRS